MVSYTSQTGSSLYSQARGRAWRRQIWSSLTGKSRQLLSLAEVGASCAVQARRHAGIRTVPIGKIRGSEGRCNDFDRDFNPLQTHTAGRWQSVAKARREGKGLPAVDLVQVGEVYFVQDGHHRISVAQALGQRDIDAKVIVWQVAGQLPWEGAEAASNQEAGGRRLFGKVLDDSARLRDRALLSLGDRLIATGTKLQARQASQAGAGA